MAAIIQHGLDFNMKLIVREMNNKNHLILRYLSQKRDSNIQSENQQIDVSMNQNSSSSMNQKIDVSMKNGNLPQRRDFSSHDTHPFCSLDTLAGYILGTYYELEDLFPELTERKVKEIQKSIREGRYTLSPLKARPLSQLTISSFEGIIIHAMDGLNNHISYEIDSTEEDKLVLIALGLM